MIKPGIITLLPNHTRYDPAYDDYCQFLNRFVCSLCVQKGQINKRTDARTTYVYQDEILRCTYVISAPKIEDYVLEISRDHWDDLPEGVPDLMIHTIRGDDWNEVYAYQSCQTKHAIMQYVPGDWDFLLTRYQ